MELEYKKDRAASYPSIEDQLDMLYWDKKEETTRWFEVVTAVKDSYPKPAELDQERDKD